MKRRRTVSNKQRRSDLGQVIARRILSEQGVVGRKVVVSIGLPRPDPLKGGDWECPFLIEGVGKSEVQKAFGVDSLQALIIAIQGIRVGLEQTGRNLFWLGPEIGPDIPLNVPTVWGKQLVARVRLAIERETVRVWRDTIKTRKTKIRAEEAELRRQRTDQPNSQRHLRREKRTFSSGKLRSLTSSRGGASRRHPASAENAERARISNQSSAVIERPRAGSSESRAAAVFGRLAPCNRVWLATHTSCDRRGNADGMSDSCLVRRSECSDAFFDGFFERC
jgi:hypothetical protein